jgi:hypothetical protein
LGSVITNDARETESTIDMAKEPFNTRKTLATSKLDLNLRKKVIKCHIWNTALYDEETGYFGQQIENTWKALKCGAGEG